MALKAVPETKGESDQDQRHDGSSQDGVRDQDGEVDRTRPSPSAKVYRANMRVVVQVAAKKDG